MDKILMCEPKYFDVLYEINGWMSVEVKPDQNLAMRQWENLYNLYTQELTVKVDLVEPVPGLPDMVFTANAGVTVNKKVIVSAFRHEERKPESAYFKQWFKNNGFETIDLPENVCFEGAGDALFCYNKLFVGYNTRTDLDVHNFIARYLDVEVISLDLSSAKYYHVDTAFFPLKNGYLIYYPQAFNEIGNAHIEQVVPRDKRIPVTCEEAAMFTCNAVNFDDVIVMNKTSSRMRHLLESKGFKLYELELGEFKKAGGSAKCMTLELL